MGHTSNFEKRKKEQKDSVEGGQTLYKAMQQHPNNWTMVKVLDFYASSRREAEHVEQRYIDELGADLNMCAAYKM